MVKLAEMSTGRTMEIRDDQTIWVKEVDSDAMAGLKEMLEHTQKRILGGIGMRAPTELFDKVGVHDLDAMIYATGYGKIAGELGDMPVLKDEEEEDMRWEDLEVALQFLPVVERGMVLQVQSAMDIPYVRRELVKRLGQPTRQYGDILHFADGKMIRIASLLSADFAVYREEELFFIERLHDNDTGLDGIEYGVASTKGHWTGYDYWRESGLSLADLYNLMLRDGMGGHTAMRNLRLTGLATV
ncbi:hypothetical protein D3C78_1306810 [compost metagenome]